MTVDPPELHFTIWGDPVGKPRQTRRDVWMRRPEVMAYRAWADVARAAYLTALPSNLPAGVPGRVVMVAFFRCPLSWSNRRRAAEQGQPHRVKPDPDNVAKSLLDALFDRDQEVFNLTIEKRWDDGRGPRLQVMLEF